MYSINENKEVEKKENITWMNYYQYHKPENSLQYLDANLRIAGNNTLRRVTDIGRGVTNLISTNEETKKEWEDAASMIRETTLATYENMEKYKQGNGYGKNFALDFIGMGVTNFADPFNIALNKVTAFGKVGNYAFNIAENMGEYIYDTWSLYQRNIFKDFRKEDAVGLGMAAVTTAGFQALNAQIKTVEGSPLYKDNFNSLKHKDLKWDNISDNDRAITEMFNSYGIFEKDKQTIIDKIRETKAIKEQMFGLEEGTVKYRELSKKLNEHKEYAVLLDKMPVFNDIDKILKGDKLTPSEFFKGFTEIKNDYVNYKTPGREWISEKVFQEIGINKDEVQNLKVRAKDIKEKYVSTVGVNSEGETLYTRNKYIDKGTEVRMTYEKNGDTFLTKASIDEQGNMHTETYRLGDVAPLDKMTQEGMKEETDAARYLKRLGYKKVVDMKNYSEFLKRKEFGRPQENYVHDIATDYHNLLKAVGEIDRAYKDEVGNNKDTVGKRSNIDTKEEMIRAIQPMYKNLLMNLKQLQAEDAEELFRVTGMVEPFGNYLWKYCESMDLSSQEFVRALQGRAELVVSDNPGFIKLIKDKLNESVRIKSGGKKKLEIEKAYYLDALHNKQDLMIDITNSAKNQDHDYIAKLAHFVGKSVDLTKEEAKAARLPWDNYEKPLISKEMEFNGEKLQVETKNYSINDYPLQMAIALRNAIESTTQQSKKGNGAWEYQSKFQIGQRWGNDGDFNNYAKIFEGYERKPYEIISEVYSTVAKDKLQLEKLNNMIDDITDNEKDFTRVTYKSERGTVQALNGAIRADLKKQLIGLKEKINDSFVDARYKPNLWISPDERKLTSSMARQTIKSLFSWKLLANFHFIREFPTNNLRQVIGGKGLGWKQRYNLLQAAVIDPIKVNVQLIKNYRNIKNGTIDKITDPLVRRRAEIFIERRLANDPIFNDIDNISTMYKAIRGVQKKVNAAGKLGGTGQLISDVHRVVNSEYAAINYLKDIFPGLKEMPGKLKKLLETNGLSDGELADVKNRLKNMSDTELMELVWNGKRAKTEVDYKIQSLFEQVSDILGREFNAFQSMEKMENGGFIHDMLFLYKRYSLGAVESFSRSLFTYQGQDGLIRKRFDFNGDFLKNYKQVFSGANVGTAFDFSQAAVGTALLFAGIRWTQGTISGSTEDERAEAKFEALFSDGAVLSFVSNSLQDFALDMSGINILYGGGTPLGGVIDTTTARFQRAWTANNGISKAERLVWWLGATMSPEFIARGIDNIKLGKSIPSRISTYSDPEDMLWKTKYSTLAKIDQMGATLPAEKILGAPINWIKYFKDNPDKAYELTGSDKATDKEAVIAGASAITEIVEEHAELTCLQEILNDDRPEYKETQLKVLGLDVDSQLHKMSSIDRKTLNSILAFKGIRDEEQILIIMQQMNSSEDKKQFLRDLLEEHELGAYRAYQEKIKKYDKEIKKRVSKRQNKTGINAYIETLEIVNEFLISE